MKKRTIIPVVIVLIIITLILLSAIIIILMKTNIEEINSTDYNSNNKFESEDTYNNKDKIEQLNNRNKYYVIKNIIDLYIEYVNEFNNSDNEEDRNLYIKELYNMLDKNYIQEFSITEESLKKALKNYSKDEEVRINNIYLEEKSSSINLFIVYTKLLKENKEQKILVKTDSLNSTFSIFLEDYAIENNINENSEKIEIDEGSIDKNQSNIFRYTNISDEQMAIYYFQDLKWMINNDSQELYKKIDVEYRNAKFSTENEYIKYIESIKDSITKRRINKYQIEEKDGYKQYVCIDQKGQYYIFKENSVMNYKLLLDTYTIDLPEFLEKYNNASEKEKIGYNIEKILEAINNKDYQYVYNKLNKTFKNNNFNNLNVFEKYVKSKFFDINDIEYKSYKQEGNSYIYNITIKDIENENNEKDLSIIVKLKEGTDFEISFVI